jgi:catechol 2,3-dioxygenase-like lactoylglutathione lyase family enzyme
MFDRVTVRVADRDASERFYRLTLATLGIGPPARDGEVRAWDDFALLPTNDRHPRTRHLHLAFVAPSRTEVDDFWRAGREAGYEDLGPPGERPQYTPSYYGAFLRDPDGNSAEAVHHADVRRGGHLDHLWIRVGDLDAAAAFYTAIMPHAGLREGRRWEHGQQFRGAWATFSLVADGAPPTENLELAFPAPDRRTVDEFHRAAVDSGHGDLGLPHERSDGDYAAAVIDPDGNRVVSVLRNRAA